MIADQHRKMCEMWLPTTFETVRRQCSRETFGYCTTSDFSFVDATCSGTGYVTLAGLLKNNSRDVLIRDTKSRQYRSAKLSVAPM